MDNKSAIFAGHRYLFLNLSFLIIMTLCTTDTWAQRDFMGFPKAAGALFLIEPLFPDMRHQWVHDERDRNNNGIEDGDEVDPGIVFSWPVHLWLPVEKLIGFSRFIHVTMFIEPQYLPSGRDARMVFGGRIALGDSKARRNMPVLIAEGGAVYDSGEARRMLGGGIGLGHPVMFAGIVVRHYNLGADTFDVSLDLYLCYTMLLWESNDFRD
jgi:hypothetical protein